MSYFRRPNPKSNWKRPKPKIYDCNTRDLEKFYQSNYNDYLSVKNEFRARDLERETRGGPEELTRRFEQRRASSLVYGEDDAPRSHRLIPNRQNSNEGFGEQSSSSSYLRSRMEQSDSSSDMPRSPRSSTSTSKSVSFSTSNSLNAGSDSGSDMAGIEQRLERLKRLREELGLPSEPDTDGGSSTGDTSSKFNSRSYETSNESSSRAGRDRFSSQGGSSARSASLSRSSPTRSNVESSYSSSKTRTSQRNGGLGDDDTTTSYTSRSSRFKMPESNDDTTSSYTSRSTRFKMPESNDDSASSYSSSRTKKYSTPSMDDESSTYTSRTSKYKSGDSNGYDSNYESAALKSRQKVAKPSLDDIDMKFDDDALLTDMRKKLPSSSEILERIKNMDIDD